MKELDDEGTGLTHEPALLYIRTLSEFAMRRLVSTSVWSSITAEGTVLMDYNTGKCFRLNSLGSKIWSALQSGLDQADIEKMIAGQYLSEPARIAADLAAFISVLEAHNLLRGSDIGR